MWTEQLYVLSHDRSRQRGWVPVKPVWQKPRARLGTRKTGLSPQYFNTDRSLGGTSVTCSCCSYLFFGSAIMLVTYFVNFRQLNDCLFGKELFIRLTACAFSKLLSVYFPFGFEGRMWDLIASVPDHCLSLYFTPHGPHIRECDTTDHNC